MLFETSIFFIKEIKKEGDFMSQADPSMENDWDAYWERDRDEDWEDWDDWENDTEADPYDVSDMMADTKEILKRATGLDNREDYENSYDYVVNHVGYHGIIGVIRGAVVTFAAIAAEIARVVISTIVGKRDHFRFGEAVRQAQDAQSLNRERKQEQRAERAKKEPEQKEQEQKEHGQKEQEQTSYQQEQTYPKKNEQKLDPELEEKMTESSKEIDSILQNPRETDRLISSCLCDPIMEKSFRELNVIPVQEEGTDRVFLFSSKAPMDMGHISCMSKEEFLKGNANIMASALYQYTEKTPESQLTSVAQAVIATAKVQKVLHPDLVNEIWKSRNDTIILSSAVFDTPDHSRAFLTATVSKYPNRADLYFNDKLIGLVPLDRATPSWILDKVQETYNQTKNLEYQVHGVAFSKEDQNHVAIRADGEKQIFSVEEERDLKAVADFLGSHGHQEYAQAMALLIGAVTNPELKESRDQDGFVINPFTEERKLPGDFRLEITGPETQIMQVGLVASNGGIREERESVLSLRGYGSRMDLESALETLKTAMDAPRKNLELAEYQQPVPERPSYESLFDHPLEGDGTAAYERLKVQAVLDGADLSELRFLPSEESVLEKDGMEAEQAVETQDHEQNSFESPSMEQEAVEEENLYEDVPYEDLMRVGYTIDGTEIDLATGEALQLDYEELDR